MKLELELRGLRYALDVSGAGPDLLLLHGFTGSGESFTELGERLSRRFRVIRPDLLGHGATEAPLTPERYRMEEAVADLQALRAALGVKRWSLLGYSMGGRLALALAAAQPASAVRLVLESSSPGLRTEREREERRRSDWALAQRILGMPIERFVDEWESLALFRSQRQVPERARLLQRRIRLAGRPAGLAGSLLGMGTGVQPSLWEALPQLRVPCLLITGELDRKFTVVAADMRALLPDAVHTVVPGAAHCVHLDAEEDFAARVEDFLAGG